jgi:hypothetical protein
MMMMMMMMMMTMTLMTMMMMMVYYDSFVYMTRAEAHPVTIPRRGGPTLPTASGKQAGSRHPSVSMLCAVRWAAARGRRSSLAADIRAAYTQCRYLDAMASKAKHGYSAFCRQDFVGIDYAMLDCASDDPLPDYYAGVLWSKLMGTAVVSAASNSSVRAYAHCKEANLTVLLLNLEPDGECHRAAHRTIASATGPGVCVWSHP